MNAQKNQTISLPVRYYRWFPPENHKGCITHDIRVDISHTAMLLVDVYLPEKFNPAISEEDQNSSLSEKDYGLWRGKITEGIIPSLEAARRIGLPVIYVCNQDNNIAIQYSAFAKKLEESLGFKPENSFKKIFKESDGISHDRKSELNFLDGVAPKQGDYYIGKTVYSGFFNTPLDSLLCNLDIKTLICAGFRLDACLLGTVLDALYRNYDVILLRDAVLASELPHEIDDEAFTHRMTTHFEAIIGSTSTSEEFIAACR